jgi:hypothetical protein
MFSPAKDQTYNFNAKSMGHSGFSARSVGPRRVTLHGLDYVSCIGPFELYRLCICTQEVRSERNLVNNGGAFLLEFNTWVESLIPVT